MPDQEEPNQVGEIAADKIVGKVTSDDRKLIEGFIADMVWRRRSVNTISIRTTYLNKLSRELGPFATVKPKALREWLADPERHLKASTQAVLLTTYHSFFTWAIKAKRLKKDPTIRIDKPAVAKGFPHPIADEDREKALANADPRMLCWLGLGCWAGCRCQEIALMSIEDIHIDTMTIYIAHGKGDKTRFVPLKDELLEALTAWDGLPTSGRLWPQMTPADMSKAINTHLHGLDAKRDDGLPATAHCLRHWYADRLYKMTKDIILVKELLGHASVATTQIYAGADMSRSAEWVGLLP